MDVNTKRLKKNAFRVTKERGLTASRVRVPGGHLDARYLSMIQDIAERYGNGSVHMTVRQGFEIPGIRYEDMDKVNELLQPIIEGIGITSRREERDTPLQAPEIFQPAWAIRSVPMPAMTQASLPLR